MSYSIPDVSYSPCNGFVHKRDLGEKSVDSGMYPDAPWSDVVLNDVPIETTIGLCNQDWNIQNIQDSLQDAENLTCIGERHVTDDIRVSETFGRLRGHFAKAQHSLSPTDTHKKAYRPARPSCFSFTCETRGRGCIHSRTCHTCRPPPERYPVKPRSKCNRDRKDKYVRYQV